MFCPKVPNVCLSICPTQKPFFFFFILFFFPQPRNSSLFSPKEKVPGDSHVHPTHPKTSAAPAKAKVMSQT